VTKTWMIYGANGYSGELIAREAKRRGMSPVLAGRNADAVSALAGELDLEWTSFDLSSVDAISRSIAGYALILHCAGPFSATARPMLSACLVSQVSYLDITGEIPVFEYAKSLNDDARRANIVICPGVGFDVIPTDCLALRLKLELPDATELTLGFDADGGLSPGTAKTALESIAKGLWVRRDGQLLRTGLNSVRREIDFGRGKRPAMAISWGDVSTAHHTTGIANITTYSSQTEEMRKAAFWLGLLAPLLKIGPILRFLQRRIESTVVGPDRQARDQNTTYLWGEVSNPHGDRVTARMTTEDSYTLTGAGSLAVVDHLLTTSEQQTGYYTPATLMGYELVERLPNSSPMQLERHFLPARDDV
jgi:short subunit dehydrogenase-like uncharacterized protein